MRDITEHVNLLADPIHEMRAEKDRIIVGIAGAPGSGKSTLASELARRLNGQKCPATVVPMDGFHLDNAILQERGLLNRKGAPETFDADGFILAMHRLKSGAEVVLPVFDRQRDISVAGALVVSPDCAVVIVEGNYLLFDKAPWTELAACWDLSARLHVPMPEIRSRLIQRWLSHGLSRAAATRRAETNDIPNAQSIIGHALPADLTLETFRVA